MIYNVGRVLKYNVIVLISLILFMPVTVSAEPKTEVVKKDSFKKESTYKVTAAADEYFIVKDLTKGLYGLYDINGEEVIPCDYDQMMFPEDSITYDYLLVKQGHRWGVFNYNGDTLIDIKYDKIDVYRDGNGVAAAYDGNVTEVFNIKGKQIGTLKGEYTVVNDDVFKNKEELHTVKDSKILVLSQEKLLFPTDDDKQEARIYKFGKQFIADYNVCEGDPEGKPEEIGNMNTTSYIKIFDERGDEVDKIVPDTEWSKDESEKVQGGICVKSVINERCVLVKLLNYKKGLYAIYNVEDKKYSQLFKVVGKFYEGHAFAEDEDGEVRIINESGKVTSEGTISIDGYERLALKKTKNDPFLIFKEKDVDKKDITYKLYSLILAQPLEDTFNKVTFARDKNKDNVEICEGYPLVCNDEENYTILNHDGTPFFGYGSYSKEDLVRNTLYSDSCLCVIQQEGSKTRINPYITNTDDQDSIVSYLLENPVFLIAIAAVILLLILIILILVIIKKRAAKREAEQKNMLRRIEMEEKARKKKEKESQKKIGVPENKFKKEPSSAIPDDSGAVPTISIYNDDESKDIYTPAPSPVKEEKDVPFYGSITCELGEYAGATMMLAYKEWIRIGRSETENDLVMNNSKVSRKHCAISYDPMLRQYLVIDYSRNGVYLENGTRLIQNQKSPVQEGSRLFLGSGNIVIRLNKKPNI